MLARRPPPARLVHGTGTPLTSVAAEARLTIAPTKMTMLRALVLTRRAPPDSVRVAATRSIGALEAEARLEIASLIVAVFGALILARRAPPHSVRVAATRSRHAPVRAGSRRIITELRTAVHRAHTCAIRPPRSSRAIGPGLDDGKGKQEQAEHGNHGVRRRK